MTTRKKKIYVASSWRNIYQQGVVETLRGFGHEVYDFKNPPHGRKGFSWADIDPNWQQWTKEQYIKALDNGIAADGFLSDYTGMLWADTCIMIMPCGRSACTEAGWMRGAGKDVYIAIPHTENIEPELMFSMHNKIFPSLHLLFNHFQK